MHSTVHGTPERSLRQSVERGHWALFSRVHAYPLFCRVFRSSCYKSVTKTRKLGFLKGKTSPENTSLTSVKWWIQNWILYTNVYLLPCVRAADLDEINDHQMVAVEYGACVRLILRWSCGHLFFIGPRNARNEFEPSILRVHLCAGGELTFEPSNFGEV